MTTCYRRHEHEAKVWSANSRSWTCFLRPTGDVLYRRSGPMCSRVPQEACSTVDRKAPLQLQHSHGALASPPQLCPPAIVHHVSPQQQVICTSPKTNWPGGCGSCIDRGTGQTGLIDYLLFTLILFSVFIVDTLLFTCQRALQYAEYILSILLYILFTV